MEVEFLKPGLLGVSLCCAHFHRTPSYQWDNYYKYAYVLYSTTPRNRA